MDDFGFQGFSGRDDKYGLDRPRSQPCERVAQSGIRCTKLCLPKEGLALRERYESNATFGCVAYGKRGAARIETAGAGGLEGVAEHLERGLRTVVLK